MGFPLSAFVHFVSIYLSRVLISSETNSFEHLTFDVISDENSARASARVVSRREALSQPSFNRNIATPLAAITSGVDFEKL